MSYTKSTPGDYETSFKYSRPEVSIIILESEDTQMKATGIVRRIDDLGRVVIPKEIRRTLRIREGDPLEIFVDREGEVILKKYSPINELGHFAKEYAEALYDSLQVPVIISDRDEVIAVAGESKKDYLNKIVSSEITKAIENRTTVFVDETKTIEILDGNEVDLESYCVCPIIANGDPIGCVLLFTKEGTKFTEVEKKSAETASSFLGRQME